MDGQHPDLTHMIGSLRRYATALVGNRDEADDLVQECLTKVLARASAAGELDGIRNLKAYLFTVLHHAYVDHVSARARSRNVVSVRDVYWQLSVSPSQSDHMELNDLQKALYGIPPAHREVILLVGLEGFSYKEAASVLGVPVGTVMSRLSRGRERLRRSLQDEPAEEAHPATGREVRDAS